MLRQASDASGYWGPVNRHSMIQRCFFFTFSTSLSILLSPSLSNFVLRQGQAKSRFEHFNLQMKPKNKWTEAEPLRTNNEERPVGARYFISEFKVSLPTELHTRTTCQQKLKLANITRRRMQNVVSSDCAKNEDTAKVTLVKRSTNKHGDGETFYFYFYLRCISPISSWRVSSSVKA